MWKEANKQAPSLCVVMKHSQVNKSKVVLGDNYQIILAKRFLKGKTGLAATYVLLFSKQHLTMTEVAQKNLSIEYSCTINSKWYQLHKLLQNTILFAMDKLLITPLPIGKREFVIEKFKAIEKELASNYAYKYDVIQLKLCEIMHCMLKIQSHTVEDSRGGTTASERIVDGFLQLLSEQYALDKTSDEIKLRTPSDFANRLHVHVNHLNRSVRLVLEVTSTDVIADFIIKKAKHLLKETLLTVSEIAYVLGFSQSTHFHTFFKKRVLQTPREFRLEGKG